jgi:hypothetical protein
MANYKEVTGSGTSWTRANRVMILNPLEPEIPKQISFFEEIIAQVDGTTIRSEVGYVPVYYSADKPIELLDPKTGEPTGETILQSKVYQALYSLYLAAAQQRDITAIAPINIPTQVVQVPPGAQPT